MRIKMGDAHACLLQAVELSRHFGLDFFLPADSNVRTPLPGRVIDIYVTDLPLDYGHAILLEHKPAEGVTFFACHHTMKAMELTLADLLPGFAVAEKGGVVKLAELQQDGWLYLRS